MSRTTRRNMTFFDRLSHLLLLAVLIGIGCPQANAAEDSWAPLFNGKDFQGFVFHLGQDGTENNGTYTIKDGVIICTGKPPGYMYTTKSYSRYTLEYEWTFKRPEGLKNDKAFGGNSGCLVHVGEANVLGVWPRCIEVQGMHNQAGLILPIPRNLKCKVTDDKEARARSLKPVGEWQTTTIDVNGGDMTISLNGTVISTVRDCVLTEGSIGFQSEGAEIHFRNIRIRVK
jgi:hypothetical protein